MASDLRPMPTPLDEIRDALAGEPPDDRAALERVWHLLGEAGPAPAEAPDSEWDALRARLAYPAPAAPRLAADRPAARYAARPAQRKWMARVLGTAAVLAIAVVAVGRWSGTEVVHVAPAGATLAVLLPDGSEVVLNSGATLRHVRRFRGTRAVTLRGEAFFDVAHADEPFVVRTRTARVEVLGTAFNVRGYDAETAVALVRGRVRVTAAGPQNGPREAAVLAPGEAVDVGAAGIGKPAVADVERAASWRRGALAFDGLPLGDILAEVERRYGIAVEAVPGTPLGARVSAYYTERPPLEALFGDIGTAAGVRFAPTATGYSVRAAPRPAPGGATASPSRAAR